MDNDLCCNVVDPQSSAQRRAAVCEFMWEHVPGDRNETLWPGKQERRQVTQVASAKMGSTWVTGASSQGAGGGLWSTETPQS